MWLVVQYYEISVTDVEARQVFTSVLSIKDILVHHERSTLRVGCITPAEGKELTKG